MRSNSLSNRLWGPAVFIFVSVGCGTWEPADQQDDDLTSAASVEKTLTLKGFVYVDPNASAYTVEQAVQRQVRTAFGPLRIAKISVDDREFKSNVDPAAFSAAEIDVVRKSGSGTGDTGTDLTPGGANARGVVALCNDPAITVSILDNDVGLSAAAAQNIVDGRPYGSITEVDAVWGIGDASLQWLLSYAKAHGYVESTGGQQFTVVKRTKRVSYTYTARALVHNSKASKSSISFALLMGNYQSFVDEIIQDCVEDYEHDQEFASSFWYVWYPGRSSCQTLINSEASAIAQERQGLASGQIGEKEYGRRYLPVTAQLDSVSAPKTTFPEYDRLYGLADPGKTRIRVYQIVGVASHDDDPESERFENDMGFQEFFKLIEILASRWGTLKVADNSDCDPTSFSYDGTSYTASFKQLHGWVVNRSGFPAEISYDERGAFLRALHDAIRLKWITLEVPLDVKAGHVAKRITLELNLLFGTESGWSVRGYFRTAFKNGDVVLYDGHSYIGSGPLDPNNYNHSDFADGYQIFFFNSCVSFNYYGVDYFDLKTGGTNDLDLVTNGIEVWINNGGKSMAQFIVALFDGKQHNWLKVLEKTQTSTWSGVHDPNRAVDGEQDNSYDPAIVPIQVTEATSDLTVHNTSPACGGVLSGTAQLSASADGAVRVEFLVDGAVIGSDSTAPFTKNWDTTAVADGSRVVTVKAFDGQGKSAEDSCTVAVQNGSGGELFFDDMEGNTSGWTATGMWHLSQSGGCAGPSYSSPVTAWYFGQEASCSYGSQGEVSGTLTSPAISGITASSALTFSFWRGVEQASSGSYDRTLVEVAAEGSGTWEAIWSLDSTSPSAQTWKSSGQLSLGSYAGKSIRLRFSFDSVDGYANDYVGWLIDDVRVSR